VTSPSGHLPLAFITSTRPRFSRWRATFSLAFRSSSIPSGAYTAAVIATVEWRSRRDATCRPAERATSSPNVLRRSWIVTSATLARVSPVLSTSLAEASVLSGLTIEDLRDGSPRWAEVRAQVAKLPPSPLRANQVQLMLAETRPQPFSEPGWLFEIKYDGFRALAAHEGGRGKLLYRHGSDATALYPDLAAALVALPADVVLDGEITVCDEQGRPSFERLQRRALLTRQPDIEHAALSLPASLFIFDLLAFENRDLRSLPLSERKALLSRLLPTLGPLHYVDHIETRGQEMFEEIARLGLEGVMAKRAESLYRAGRSSDWFKIRRDRSADFAVVGYTAPRGLRSGLGALHLAAQESGALVYMGRVGSGLGEKEDFYPGHRFHFPLSRMVMAAKAAGLAAIDAPYGDYKDSEGLRRSCLMSAALGYDGKWVIHPDQIAIVNEVYSPSQEDVERSVGVDRLLDRLLFQSRFNHRLHG